MRKSQFPFYKQPDQMDCGPTCLRMIAKYYGRSISLEKLRTLSETTRIGSSLHYLSEAAEKIGFRSLGVKIDFDRLVKEAPLPCIVFWQQQHFVIVHKIKKDKVYVADPGQGLMVYSKEEFIANWIGKDAVSGVVLLLEATPNLKIAEDDDKSKDKKGFAFLFQYIFKYKSFLFQLAIGLLAGSILQLIIPFLTQSVVDIGIQTRDINFIYLILFSQLGLFFGKMGLEIIQGWILLHLSARINISLVADFFVKLMRLPISYFDSKMTGDILQRINDHSRIENLLTSASLGIPFSLLNIFVYGAILAWYDISIFAIFFIGSIINVFWVFSFLKKRKDLDYKKFSKSSDEQSKVIELINGMQEIKLHNAERQKRWEWEHLQAKLFKIGIKTLRLEQVQGTGSSFFNELKNILISFLAAKLVIDGELTLGMMLSLSYITGQLNGPIQQLVSFVHTFQDAKIALERLSEIHNKKNEEPNIPNNIDGFDFNRNIEVKNMSFRYKGSKSMIFEDVSLTIPVNKMTAIVGASGSGKTTLMKILLKYYDPNEGSIFLGNQELSVLPHNKWRQVSGTVMQDGYIFNDTIANNIALGSTTIDTKKLLQAAEIANVKEFVENLPMGFSTEIGMEGMGISSGQRQRILIARAIYKNPDFIFFDEATSALDANNEAEIMEKLTRFFQSRTSVIIAHRLSTVKNADQILVLDNGKIIEKGNHEQLIALKGSYFNLVKNQLALEKLDTDTNCLV